MYNLGGRSKLNMLGLLLAISTFVLLVLCISSTTHSRMSSKNLETRRLSIHERIQIAHIACEGTLYTELCVGTLQSLPHLTSNSLPEFISATLNHSMREIVASYSKIDHIQHKRRKYPDPLEKVALNDCLELFDNTIVELRSALSDLSTQKAASLHYPDLQTLLSGAMTNQYTCIDGFTYGKGNVRERIQNSLFNVSRHLSNSLVMLKKIHRPRKHHSKSEYESKSEVLPEYGDMKNGFPSWLSSKDRRLLQASVNSTIYDLIVAKDGTGNFTNISDAVAAAPKSSNTRFVIYIKAGAYFENVEVDRTRAKLMLVGDGIGRTVVKASRNVVDGWTTFRSATVAAVGDGFIAKGITFENAAGPSKHQAVAFRSGSDFSAFYKCSFVAYQDTLYVHSLRQFYRECDIYGTIDFIFGNAAVVFQNCNLYARKPNEKQRNIFTAQGRVDPNQNTGISILNCELVAAADFIPVQSSFKTYLGRPWKEFSRTVIMRSNIGDLVDPAGWLEWNGSFALSTLYYGEYQNRGPGSNTSARVTWPGYRVINSSTEASQFTVGAFIRGNDWLNSTTIPFYLNLTA